MNLRLYNEAFFAHHEEGSRRTARATIPLVLELVQPRDVVDVGCGNGAWLAEFRAAGIGDYLGIDGDYVNRETLLVEPDRFAAHDLKQPLKLDRRFDLAMCLEVAEHLPEDCAGTLIASLVALAPVVLFSAAIPYQGGDEHLNEQWPEYWQALFAANDYVVVDAVRERLWRNKDIKPWYAQNMLFYVNRARLGQYPALATVFEQAGENPRLSIVHPEHYVQTYQHMMKNLTGAQQTLLRFGLRLREVNLLVAPDWSMSHEVLASELRALIGAAVHHPDAARMTVLFKLTGTAASALLMRVANEVLMPGGVPLANAPVISGIGPDFHPHEWQVLLPMVQARVPLEHEDRAALEQVGGLALPALGVNELLQKQTLDVP